MQATQSHTAKPSSPTNPNSSTEPDIVDRIFEMLAPELESLQVTPEKTAAMREALRYELGGTREWIRKPDRSDEIAAEVLRLFNGRNATEVARQLGIGRATVYRKLKQAGGTKG